jgi:aspartyl-tRNA(Asn)/glutamyl-tRNA(Gln) amidotransferase subunit C
VTTWRGTGRVYSRPMPVEIDIAKVAKLARLALSDEDLATYGSQLEGIIEHAERVGALPTEGVAPTSHPLPMTNAFRADETRPSLDRDEVLEQAPAREGDYFRVPRILGES